MQSVLKKPLTLLVMQLLALWPVWRWYALRVTDGSDESWGWIALVTALLFIASNKAVAQVTLPQLMLPGLLLLCYTLSYHFLPSLLRAVIALAAVCATISAFWFSTRLHFGLLGLFWLSLPVIASLQFYLGFPLRALVALTAAPLLRLGGLAVVSEGTCLNWNDQLIAIDAPCSGVRMLWAGLYLTFTLACFWRLNVRRTLAAALLAVVVIVAGNVFRALGLFYLETGLVRFPAWAHEGMGVLAFALTAAALVWLVQRIKQQEERCALAPSS